MDAPNAPNTRFSYMYRDASNYKTGAELVLAGEVKPADRELIAERLDQGEWFIPSQVGLRDLQRDFNVEGALYEDDHVWHELDVHDIEPVDAAPTVEMSWGELVARFAAVSDWDVTVASARVGL